jgi:hypothetical protein
MADVSIQESNAQIAAAAAAIGLDWTGSGFAASGDKATNTVTSVLGVADTPSGGGGVSMSQLNLGATLGSPTASPLATGFPLFQQMLDNLLKANADRRAEVDQQINLQRLLVDMGRVSPTSAADLATAIGLGDQQPDLSFLSRFLGSGAPAAAGGGYFGGKVGTQNVVLPETLNGKQLSFLGSNPNVANVVADAAAKFGMPDLFNRSKAALLPTSNSIFSGGF